jgi:drug/metabolite transporter (DMT)-like permease
MKKPDAFSCLIMTLVGAIWGLHGPAIKFAFAAGFTFPQLVLGEFLVSSLFFGGVAAFQGVRPPADRRFWAAILAAGAAGCGVPLFLFWAYRLGPVPIGATLFFLYVPFTQLLNLAVTRRPPVPRELGSAALVIAGALLATDFLDQANASNLRGVPFAVLAAACFAAFFVLSAGLGHAATPVLRSFICCAISSAVLLVVAAAAGWHLVPGGISPARTLLWLAALGVFWQVIPLFLVIRFIPRTGSGLGSILTSTELPVAVVSSALLLGDHIRPSQMIGVGLVLAGIALPQLPVRRLQGFPPKVT